MLLLEGAGQLIAAGKEPVPVSFRCRVIQPGPQGLGSAEGELTGDFAMLREVFLTEDFATLRRPDRERGAKVLLTSLEVDDELAELRANAKFTVTGSPMYLVDDSGQRG